MPVVRTTLSREIINSVEVTMRLGVFGGSFDPVHYGHLLLAEACREQCLLDEVWFMPAANPPHKSGGRLTPGKQRVAMLELAIGGHAPFRVSSIELNRGGVSYTVDTLSELHTERPDDELFFLMGSDSLAEFSTWREPRRICELASPLVVRRPGSPEPAWEILAEYMDEASLARIREHQARAPLIELSSTNIRESVRAGRSIRFQTPRAVESYIIAQRLFVDDETVGEESAS